MPNEDEEQKSVQLKCRYCLLITCISVDETDWN